MSDVLDRIRGEITERLQASHAAVQEYERLQAALAALDTGSSAPPAATPNSAATPATTRKQSKSAKRRAASGPRRRAPRGQNRRRVLAAVADRPGVTAPELASVSGVKGGTLYTLLRRLIGEGALTKRNLPGGDSGYQIAEGETTA